MASAAGLVRQACANEPDRRLTWALHVSVAPTWFDPAETTGITWYMLLYAMQDALVKAMPGELLAPSLAESWTVASDGLSYEFLLREGATFHNGDPVTSGDVQFSFERYRGALASEMKSRVASVETDGSRHVRFNLKQPWPDFLMLYTMVTGAGWVVPKKYLLAVGDEGFKKAPIGAGPYRFVSYRPGIELVLEAFDQYWRKAPAIKQLVFKVIPDATTRLAALKRGEVDIAYQIRSELAEELQRTPGFGLKPVASGTQYLDFPDQWDPKSPWHDRRVRLAANLAIDRTGINQAVTLGHSVIAASVVPDDFDFYWQPPAPTYDPAQAKRLLARAGYPNGFDAGDYTCDNSYAIVAEAVIDNLNAVGVRAKLRPLERVAFTKAYFEKKLKNIVQVQIASFGNAATRLEAVAVKGGIAAYGSDSDIDLLFKQQAAEVDRGKRKALLYTMQQLIHERMRFAPILQPAFLSGVGPRVGEPSIGRIAVFPYTMPYEDVTLANR
jgi:peptide/nickel transport system substrate-binding protein